MNLNPSMSISSTSYLIPTLQENEDVIDDGWMRLCDNPHLLQEKRAEFERIGNLCLQSKSKRIRVKKFF